MTYFEELAKELGVRITVDGNGLYTKHAAALANITNSVILSEDDKVFELPWDEQKKMIAEKFYRTFPYMMDQLDVIEKMYA